MLQDNLFSSAVSVENRAVGSRSSKSFINEGRLTAIMNEAESGDYLLVSFAFNDFTDVEERMALTGKAETDKNGYKYWLKKYIDACSEKGVILVFVTAPPTYNNEGKKLGAYADEMKQMAEQYSIPVIDVYSKINALDTEIAKGYYMIFNKSDYANDDVFNTQSRYKGLCDSSADGSYKDVIHFRKEGAAAIAEYITDGLRNLSVIGNYVK